MASLIPSSDLQLREFLSSVSPGIQESLIRLASALEDDQVQLSVGAGGLGVRQETEPTNPKEFVATYPTTKQAAVLILLLELPVNESRNQLYVILTTRAKNLRTHGGQTSLPGGKRDPEDLDIIQTAYREAHEEIGLPLPTHLRHICNTCSLCATRDSDIADATSPTASLGSYNTTIGLLPCLPFQHLLVRPVIAFISRPDLILPVLKPSTDEVDLIFLHPLENILDPKEILAPSDQLINDLIFGEVQPPSNLVPRQSEHWPYEEPYHKGDDHTFESLGGMTYRDHLFRTCASPITGMTSDILIQTAQLTYGKEPTFERHMEGQIQDWTEMSHMLLKVFGNGNPNK